jgi:hypothetical protein
VAFNEVSDLVREFRSYRRFAGPLGPIRKLFTCQYDVRRALDAVSVTIASVRPARSSPPRSRPRSRRTGRPCCMRLTRRGKRWRPSSPTA